MDITQQAPEAPQSPQALALARQYAALAEDRRAVFRARARAQGLDVAALPAVPIEPRPARFPLLAAQERLWFLWCLDPAHAGYHVTHALCLKGPLDHDALHRALRALIARHEALRLRFDAGDGVPTQYPVDTAEYAFTAAALTDGVAELDALLGGWARKPFDLSAGPLIRVGLFETGPARHVLQIVVHHIVADAWSMQLLFDEWLRLYRGDAALPALPLQFADYALWQREWSAGAQLERQIDAWRRRMDGAPSAITLPYDLPPRARRSHDGGRVRASVPAVLADRLRDIARRNRTTLFTLLLAAYDILLSRYAGQRTVVVGVPSAGRERRETEPLIGFFVDTLIVRADLIAAQHFEQFLAQVHERVLEAQTLRDVPFARLVEALGVARDLDRSPLFQVMFDLAADMPSNAGTHDTGGLVIEALADRAPTARFELALNARDRGARAPLEFALTYACDRFVEASAERMLGDYVALLEQIAADASRPLGRFELGRVRVARDAVHAPLPAAFVPVHTRIAQRARLCPARVALRCDGAALTYAQLDAWSDTLAHALRAAGLAPGERVGLLLARSLALPVALLAVFKAGGAFVPLDPDYPPARLRMMLADAGVTRVVIDSEAIEHAPAWLASAHLIAAGQAPKPSEPSAPLRWAVPPDALAYVIYTSGSTGTPKGVAVSHRALALHLDDFLHDHGIAESDVVLQSSTINFDVALHELLPALIAGGRVVMRGPRAWELASLNRTLIDERVTFARIPTALWQQWRMALPPAHEIALRQITVGGEALPGDALQRWYQGPLAHVAIDNLYGPTETTVAALHHRVVPADAAQAIVAIGRCYPVRRAYVADLDGNRAPPGAPGELCIGGATLAQGYLGRPGLTAERFVPDPYGAPGARVYRSGDLCRARGDGIVDFLGRIDQQIKLRGHRIELGEIEAAVRGLDGVGEAVAELRGSGARKRLVAYYTGAAHAEAVREALTCLLPASHVPSVCMPLDTLPTLPNGKLDRRALPEPDDRPAAIAQEPQGGAETALLGIWRTVLGRDDFGVADDFFALGGDSISSLRVIAQARAAGWRISARQMFEQPTVRLLARVAEPLDTAAPAPGAGPEAEPQPETAPLVPMQHGFFETYPDAPSRWNQAVLLRSGEPLRVDALRLAFDALLVAHDALRAAFTREAPDGTWVQTILPAGLPGSVSGSEVLWADDLRAAADPGAALDALIERAHTSLDLGSGRLLRAVCVAMPDGARLLIVAHHLVIDGVSWRVLLDDLLNAYEAACTRLVQPVLPRPATSWRDWTRRLAAYAARPEHLGEIAWWQAHLGTCEAVSDPAPLPAGVLYQSWQLDAPATRRLSEAGRRIDEVLLAALAQACRARLPEWEVIVELEGHGRDARVPGTDLSRTLGWFTTQFPLRIEAAGDVAATCLAVGAALRAVPAGGMHYNLFRYAAEPSTREALAALPRATIGFNYLGRFEERLSEGRFTFAPESSGEGIDARAARPRHALDLNALIADGCLKVEWSAAEAMIDAAGLAQLVAAFGRQVRVLTEAAAPTETFACATEAAGTPVPTLFDALDPFTREDQRRESGDTADRMDDLPGAAFALWRERFYVEAMLRPARTPEMQPLNASGAPCMLFCFYPGYGLTGEYRFLAAALQGIASMVALRSPAFSAQACTPPVSLEALARRCAAQVNHAQPDGALHLLGWSFGGRLAVAVAACLREMGRAVAFVGLLDTATHSAVSGEADGVDAADTAEDGSAGLAAWLDAQPDGEHLQPLFERAAMLDAQHYRLRQAHTLPVLDVPLTFWRAARDTVAGRLRDWRPYTHRAVDTIEIDATHAGIVLHPALHASVAQRLRELAAAHRAVAEPHRGAST